MGCGSGIWKVRKGWLVHFSQHGLRRGAARAFVGFGEFGIVGGEFAEAGLKPRADLKSALRNATLGRGLWLGRGGVRVGGSRPIRLVLGMRSRHRGFFRVVL